ncbi:MAG: NAD(P)/FAD-dependent oxidoreductase [Gemmatimonadota bacterium]
MASPEPTLIIGGGIAGLICARELTRAGHPVALYEKEAEVGGRVRTTLRDGFRLDHGFQVLFTAYPTLTAALDLPALQLRTFRPAAVMAAGSRHPAVIGDALADFALLWPTLVAPQLSLLDKVRMLQLRQLATSLAFDDCFAPQFDAMSTRAFLQRRGFTDRAIANFFAPFYGGILLDRSLESSASVLLYTFKMLAEGRTVVPADGMGAIPAQLAAQLPAGCVRTDSIATRLVVDGGALQGVLLGDGSLVRASSVVLACDPPMIATLAATAGVHVDAPDASLGCTTLYFRSRTPLLDGDALWLNTRADATVSHAITISNVAPSYAPSGEALTAATVLGAAATLPDDELLRRVRTDLSGMSRDATAASAELLATWRVPYSQYAQPPGSSGRRVAADSGLRGLVLASEMGHTSSLEGAARGGVMAARAVLRGQGQA